MSKIITIGERCGRSIKYNRFSKEQALDICSRKVRLHKSPLEPITCRDCYYHDHKCELGKNESPLCFKYINDISFTNRVRKAILNDYCWCIINLDKFCQVDKELFVAIYGKKEDGMIKISEDNL